MDSLSFVGKSSLVDNYFKGAWYTMDRRDTWMDGWMDSFLHDNDEYKDIYWSLVLI
jgi:hypothetical protein